MGREVSVRFGAVDPATEAERSSTAVANIRQRGQASPSWRLTKPLRTLNSGLNR
jgi:hypothetical protein